MDYQNYLYLEYRRTLRKFRKLQIRFEKRIAKDTFQELTIRRRHKLLSQLRKLKQKIEQLTGRLKLATAAGALAVSFGLQDAQAQQEVIPGDAFVVASGVSGTPKYLTVDRVKVNDVTTGVQEKPCVSYNNNDNFVVVWQEDGNGVYGKAYGHDLDENITFEILGGENVYIQDPVVAMNDEDDFVVAWVESAASVYSVKYMRYNVEDGNLTSDGPYTTSSGASNSEDVDIALDDSGNFVIVWEQSGAFYEEVKARYYTADNTSEGELAVSQNTDYPQKNPSVDIENGDEFIVVWEDAKAPDTSYGLISYRKYEGDTPQDDPQEAVSQSNAVNKILTPDVDLNGDGSFVIAWEHEQYGGSSEYIRAQIFDDEGSPQVDGDITVAEFQYATNPKIAADKDGGFVVVYDTDEYSGNQSIKGSRYNRFGDQIESWDFYNEGDEGNVASHPAIGMNDRGNFVVAWDDNLNSLNEEECPEDADCDGSAIYFKRYENGSNPPYNVSPSQMVNTYSNGGQIHPAIAKDGEGNYIVVWQGYFGEDVEDEILGQRFNNEGEKVGDEFKINTTTTDDQTAPDIAMNTDGEFIVTWESYDQASSSNKIYAQMYDASGETVGNEIRVDQTSGFINHTEPSAAIDDDGDAIIVYVHSYNQVLARRINADGTTDGDEFKVDAKTDSGARSYPDVALDNDGSFVVTFGLNNSSGYQDTYYRRFSVANTPLNAEDVKISEEDYNDTSRQSIVMDADGNFVIAYTEYYDNYYAVKVSKFTKEGSTIIDKIELTNFAYDNFVPGLDINAQGEIAVAWEEGVDGTNAHATLLDTEGDVIFERYLPFGRNTGQNLALILDDKGLTTMVRDKYDYPDGYGVFSATFARPLEVNIDNGDEFIVNSTSTYDQDNPDIAQNANGNFVIVWRDRSDGSYTSIRAQRYNSEGIRRGAEMIVNNSTTSYPNDPSVALTNDGNFMVVWTESGVSGGSEDDVIGNVFDWDGNNIKDDFIINETTISDQLNPDVALNPEGEFQVIWSERYDFEDQWNRVYGQKFLSDGTADLEGNKELFEIDESQSVNIQTSLAINQTGDIAIAYLYTKDGPSGNGLFVFDNSFNTKAGDLTYSESGDVEDNPPSIASSEDGDFVMVWSEYVDEGSPSDLLARKYSGESEFATDAYIIDELEEPYGMSIAAVDDGDFIVSYINDDGSYGVFLRRISSDLEPIGPEIQINEIPIGDSYQTAIASSPDGSYTIAWESGYADDNGYAIVARQFVSHKPKVDVFGLTLDEGASNALTDDHIALKNTPGKDDALALTIQSLPTEGTLKLDGSDISLSQTIVGADLLLMSYAHSGSESTSDQFTFSVANENFETNIFTFSINVNPVNDAPVVADGISDQTGNKDVAFELSLTGNEFSDAENESLTLTASLSDNSDLPEWLTFDATSSSFSGTPNSGNDYTIKLTASDGELFVSDEFELSIEAVPIVSNAIEDQTGTVGEEFSLELADNVFTDEDGDELTLSATLADGSALPTWLSFDAGTATFSGTPDEITSYTVKVTATDETTSVSDEFVLTIGNQTPTVANPIADQTTNQYDTYTFAIPTNTFADDGELSLSASQADDSSLPDWLSFSTSTNTLFGTSGVNDNGEVSIKITATDGVEATVSTTFKLTINFVLSTASEKLGVASFYPNPVEHLLNFQVDESMNGDIAVSMFDQSGKIVSQSMIHKTYSSQVFEIDVQNLQRGIYFVKLVNENTTSTFKINKK